MSIATNYDNNCHTCLVLSSVKWTWNRYDLPVAANEHVLQYHINEDVHDNYVDLNLEKGASS